MTVVISPSDATVDEGNSAIFTCVAYGSPTPSFTWSRTDGDTTSVLTNDYRITITDTVIEEGGVTFVQSTFEVCSVGIADSSQYTCTAMNDAGTSDASFELTVSSTVDPGMLS